MIDRTTASLASLTFAALLVTTAAHAGTEVRVEDFEDGGVGGFDPAFNHVLDEAFILDFNGGFVIGMAPGTDTITFNLAPGETVLDASVTIIDFCGTGCSTVEFVGTTGSETIGNTIVGSAEIVAASAAVGEVTTIILASFEGFFDDVTINVDLEGGGDPCPTDVDGDNDTGFGDLVLVLANWGCTTCPDLDFDDSGVIDFGDLLGVLAVWGPCTADEACCYPDGSCEMLSIPDCKASGGNSEGPGSDCESASCGF